MNEERLCISFQTIERRVNEDVSEWLIELGKL
jgi:hypothetical protein